MEEKQKADKNKGNNVAHWLLWWQIDNEAIENEVKNYDKLKFHESSRGISVLLLLLSAIVTVLFIFFLNFDPNAFVDVFLFLVLSFFVYKGKQWAMLAAMILWTYEKIYLLIDGGGNNAFISILWWATYMHAFYSAFKVERLRKKLNKPTLITNSNNASNFSNLNDLEKLSELKDKGVITEEDFNKKKAQILGL